MALVTVVLIVGVTGCAAALLGVRVAEWLAGEILGPVWGAQ